MIYGYARTSTTDQENSLETQIAALKEAGCEMVRSEMVSGATIENRTELRTLLDFMREGDTLVVTKLDRLARSTLDMLTIVEQLGERGVGVRSLSETWLDTSSSHGRLFLTMIAGIAQWERERIRERQREGIERAKERGVYVGRKRQHDPERIRELRSEGLSMSRIAAELGCSEDTVRRALREKNGQPSKLAELGAPGI